MLNLINLKFLSLFIACVFIFNTCFCSFNESIWYKLDGNYADEINGNTLGPSGSGYSFVSGKIGNGWSIGGSAFAYRTGVSGFASGNFDFSSSLWYKPSSNPPPEVWAIAFYGSLNSDHDGFGLCWRDGPKIFTWIYGEAGAPGIYQNLTVGTWYHIVNVYTASTRVMEYFVNSASIGSDVLTSDMKMNLNQIRIGGIDATGSVQGVIDDVRYYEAALDQDAIDFLYNNSYGTSLSLSIMGAATESQGRAAIEDGIMEALGAYTPIYTNQSIFVTYSNGTQAHAVFDKVARYQNKTWAFNYITGSETYANMMNITNILYTWEHEDMTAEAIETSVNSTIQNTKE